VPLTCWIGSGLRLRAFSCLAAAMAANHGADSSKELRWWILQLLCWTAPYRVSVRETLEVT